MNNFHSGACTSLVISRLLGLAITAGSCMLFFPQIAKIHAAKSAQGEYGRGGGGGVR